MPIDSNLLNSMIGTFKTMMEDCKSKNLSGDAFDQMCATYERMEQLGQEHSDMNAFNAQLTEENLFANFSNYYSQALAQGASNSSSSTNGASSGYDDQALLQQTIDALKSAIQEQKSAFERAKQESTDNAAEIEVLMNPEDLIQGIQDMIDLGEQEGMTYPKFLRIQIEKGLDKAMDGGTTSKKSLQYELEFAQANVVSPLHIEKAEKKLEKYNALAEQSAIGIPNKNSLKVALNEIDREYEPRILAWEKGHAAWEKLFNDIAFWSLSYCSFAPTIEPWSMSANPAKAVLKTQKITPGIFRAREKRYQHYYDGDFKKLLQHPSFKWEVEHHKFGYSQEFMTYILQEVLPNCQPNQDLSNETKAKHEDMYTNKRTQNPEIMKYQENFAAFYDQKFGAGRYWEKYGPKPTLNSNAEPWNWSEFEKEVF